MAELSEKDTKLFTTEMVLFELTNALSASEFRAVVIILIDELRTLQAENIKKINRMDRIYRIIGFIQKYPVNPVYLKCGNCLGKC